MGYISDVAISMNHRVKDQILEEAAKLGDSVDDYIIDKLKDPDVENPDGIFIQFNSVRWLNYSDVNPTIGMIETAIEDNPEEARLVGIGMPDSIEIGQYNKVRCFYPNTYIEVEEPA